MRGRIDALPTNEDILIKSPTFGTPEVLVNTTILSFHKDGDNDWYCTDENPIQGFTTAAFDYNAVYKVEWDGVEYEEFVVQYESNPLITTGTWYEWCGIGNVNFLDHTTAYMSSAPFAITYDYYRNAGEVQIFTTSTNSNHTLKITKIPFIVNNQPRQYYDECINNYPIIKSGKGFHSLMLGGSAVDASGEGATASGISTIASGRASFATGAGTVASGNFSFAGGFFTNATNNDAFAIGSGTVASGLASYAEGSASVASNTATHAEGIHTIASGLYAHAEGNQTSAIGAAAHTEGYMTSGSSTGAHAEGRQSEASGAYSHVEGRNTIAAGQYSHVSGKYNVEDTVDNWPEWSSSTSYSVGDKVKVTTINNDETTVNGYTCKIANSDLEFTSSNWILSHWRNYAVIIGNGSDGNNRSNAYSLDWDGNGHYIGNVYVGCNADSSGGTKLIKATDIATLSTAGIVKVNADIGVAINNNGELYVNPAVISAIKSQNGDYRPIVPRNQNAAVFYGLAQAAGDTTMAVSSNSVGTYTTEALTAIHTMLGIDPASIAAQVEIPLVETVTGTTPTITGQPNTRYVCGEVSTLSITPPSVGSIDVIFDSGSTPAVITVPNTVRWPAWFDATALEADTTYEILITDGVYGSVMTWEN